MKRNKLLILTLLFVIGFTPLSAMRGFKIMEKVDKIFKVRNSLLVSEMKIIDRDGSSRSFIQWGMVMKNRQVSKFASGLVKGMTMLSIDDGDQIYVYFKSSGRTRRLASSAKNSSLAGSDFSYSDYSNTKYSQDWKSKLISSSGDSYQLVLTPKKRNSNYSKLDVYVKNKNFLPYKIVYYNEDGLKQKMLTIDKAEVISGILTPLNITMKNLISGTRTEVTTSKIKYVSRLSSSFFSSSGLSKSLENWKATYPFFK